MSDVAEVSEGRSGEASVDAGASRSVVMVVMFVGLALLCRYQRA